jgi:hypothetical protein
VSNLEQIAKLRIARVILAMRYFTGPGRKGGTPGKQTNGSERSSYSIPPRDAR